MKMPDEDDLQKLLEAPPFEVGFSGPTQLQLLGALQLVLRHPEFNHTAPAKTVRHLAEKLEQTIVEASPGMKDLCHQGWNPDSDQKIATVHPLGPTGKFPEGKLNDDDEGELRFAVAADKRKGVVVVDLGGPVRWMALPKSAAIALGVSLVQRADEL